MRKPPRYPDLFGADASEVIAETRTRIAVNISEAIDKSGKSQGQVAREMGVTQGTVSRWRSGAFCPGVDTLVILARVLHVPLAFMVKGLIDFAGATAKAGGSDGN